MTAFTFLGPPPAVVDKGEATTWGPNCHTLTWPPFGVCEPGSGFSRPKPGLVLSQVTALWEGPIPTVVFLNSLGLFSQTAWGTLEIVPARLWGHSARKHRRQCFVLSMYIIYVK